MSRSAVGTTDPIRWLINSVTVQLLFNVDLFLSSHVELQTGLLSGTSAVLLQIYDLKLRLQRTM